MSDTPARPAPFSLRLSPEERARLKIDAAGVSMASHIKALLFASAEFPAHHRRSPAVIDQKAVAALLAKLGQTRIASNLNQLAKATHSGSLVLTPDIEAELHEAIADIRKMRELLVTALGLLEDRP